MPWDATCTSAIRRLISCFVWMTDNERSNRIRWRSFRLGLVEQRLPAIWGGWQHNGLLYKVSVMTVPSAEHGNFDLYKLQVQNATSAPIPSQLAATLEGPPDMRRGRRRRAWPGRRTVFDRRSRRAAPERTLRDWGLCDKRAKAYGTGGGPGKTEPAVASYRVGLDGLPVLYRVKAEPAKKYLVYLVSTPHIGGYLLEQPKKPGDLVFEYQVEGLAPQTLDWVQYIDGEAATAVRPIRGRSRYGRRRIHHGVFWRGGALAHPTHAAECHLRASAGHECTE